MGIEALLGRVPVVPVLTIEALADAVPLARALVRGGLPVLEITLRTRVALDAVRAIAAEVPDAVVGVGTVLRPGQLQEAARAGAAYAVSPGLTERLAEAAAEHDLPFLPGAATASEVMRALDAGFQTLKFFPAEPLGGVAALRAFLPVFPDARFCPTGGIDEARLASYLALSNVLAVGGSWVAPQALVEAGDFVGIEALARRAAAFRR